MDEEGPIAEVAAMTMGIGTKIEPMVMPIVKDKAATKISFVFIRKKLIYQLKGSPHGRIG